MAIDDIQLGRADFVAEVTDLYSVMFVSLTGELDLSTAEECRDCLAGPDFLRVPRVIVDVSRLTFLGSTGIGVLVSACKRVRASGASFSVVCGKSRSRGVLEISGLIDYFQVEDASPLSERIRCFGSTPRPQIRQR